MHGVAEYQFTYSPGPHALHQLNHCTARRSRSGCRLRRRFAVVTRSNLIRAPSRLLLATRVREARHREAKGS